MNRLFIALHLPDALAPAFQRLKDASLPTRWTPPAQYHLTLKFIGSVPDERVRVIQELLETVERDAFPVAFTGLAVFPHLRAPRVLVAQAAPDDGLLALQSEVERLLAVAGIEPEQRPYRPHLTLARFSNASPEAVRNYLDQRAEVNLPGFTASAFNLYASELHPAGAVHTLLSAYPLRAIKYL